MGLDYDTKEHKNKPYKICLTKTGYIFIRTAGHMKQIITEQYLHDEIMKAERNYQSDNDFNRIVNSYSLAHRCSWHTDTCRETNFDADIAKEESKQYHSTRIRQSADWKTHIMPQQKVLR